MPTTKSITTSKNAEGTGTLSAGPMVYSIPHIRRQIIQNLPDSGLANLIRVEKGCLEEVSRELYYEVAFDAIDDYFSLDPVRERAYSNAVTHISASSLTFSPAMRRIPGWERFDRRFCVDRYDPITFNFIIPYFRLRFPNVRRIDFSHDRQVAWNDSDRWSVMFDAPLDVGERVKAPTYGQAGYVGEHASGGVIHLLRNHTFDLRSEMDEGMRKTRAPTLPRGPYTIQYRFNVELGRSYRGDLNSELSRRWARAFREESGFANLHTSFAALSLPMTFDDLTVLYGHQISARRSVRLKKIQLGALSPWDMTSFATFAAVACTSLTSLDILGHYHSLRPSFTFEDIPAFTAIVREHLPNLTKLAMTVATMVGAEDICKGLLRPDALRAGGTIKDIRITGWRLHGEDAQEEEPEEGADTRLFDPEAFNVIRVLSALCSANASVSISDGDPASQTEYLRYLRRQPLRCQAHLATVDFLSLGLGELREIIHLSYDDHGQPFKAAANDTFWVADREFTAEWSASLATFNSDFSTRNVGRVRIQDGTASCRGTAARLAAVAATAPAWEKLALAKRLLGQMEPLKKEVDRLTKSLDVKGVREYVKVLEDEISRARSRGGV